MIKDGRNDSEFVATRRTQRLENVASQSKTLRPAPELDKSLGT